jgi:hypothetical protein
MTTRKFKIGDRVRVEKTPRMDSSWPAETVKIFKRVIGDSFQIRGFNQIGLAEIWAKDNGSPARGGRAHSLWIEMDCIKLVAKKK